MCTLWGFWFLWEVGSSLMHCRPWPFGPGSHQPLPLARSGWALLGLPAERRAGGIIAAAAAAAGRIPAVTCCF